ncbi:hypothetical protein IU433_23045 [Nocardia puris]|uniref:Uncharacterized protein n=1 Tax=Nocardia puris TaxID=208602 RepID=A0A366DE70_9NOCA|nr:hypothetical protein [Nocardia puris]MBF6212104.1 hypothetical protein [Nocardia puris]MBF6367130.1 hypothetical protein [Nocardia puris]MBF6461893.1 hypothetical protein [Nocardia puris]RBO88350.1 hypothetical protein DFR74_109118 [Nocardia puris]
MSTARRVRLVHDQNEFAEAKAAEKAEVERVNAMAARTVAGHSQNAADCESLLAMLGLDALAGRQIVIPPR